MTSAAVKSEPGEGDPQSEAVAAASGVDLGDVAVSSPNPLLMQPSMTEIISAAGAAVGIGGTDRVLSLPPVSYFGSHASPTASGHFDSSGLVGYEDALAPPEHYVALKSSAPPDDQSEVESRIMSVDRHSPDSSQNGAPAGGGDQPVAVSSGQPRRRRKRSHNGGLTEAAAAAAATASARARRRPVSVEEQLAQRMQANVRERQRTQDLNQAFSHLRDIIPTLPSDKLSKIQTLKLAFNYIDFLNDLLEGEERLEAPHGVCPKYDTYYEFKEILSFSFGKKRMDKVVSRQAAETAAALASDFRRNDFGGGGDLHQGQSHFSSPSPPS